MKSHSCLADVLYMKTLTLKDKEAWYVTFSVHNTPKHFRSTLSQLMGQFNVHGRVRRTSSTTVSCRPIKLHACPHLCPVLSLTAFLPSVTIYCIVSEIIFSIGRGKTLLLVVQVTCKAVASLLNKDGMAHFIAAVKTIAEPYEVSEGDPPQKAPFTVFNGTVQAVSNDEALTMLKSRVQVCMHQDDV